MVFCHNIPRAIHETVGDETLVIDSETGTYFSLKGVASEIWNLLESPADARSIAKVFGATEQQDASTVEADIAGFLSGLEAEGLIVKVDGGVPTELEKPDTLDAWSKPEFEKHTDMERLLTVDTIHLVEETGWPHAKGG